MIVDISLFHSGLGGMRCLMILCLSRPLSSTFESKCLLGPWPLAHMHGRVVSLAKVLQNLVDAWVQIHSVNSSAGLCLLAFGARSLHMIVGDVFTTTLSTMQTC